MSFEEIFNASKKLIRQFGEFFKDVAEEVGEEKAIDLLTRFYERRGTSTAKLLKEQRPDIDLNAFAELFAGFYASLGYENEYEVTHKSIIFKTRKCPFYEGFKEAGIAHETIEEICNSIISAYEGKLKDFNPNARYKLNFRTSDEDFCLEEITLN